MLVEHTGLEPVVPFGGDFSLEVLFAVDVFIERLFWFFCLKVKKVLFAVGSLYVLSEMCFLYVLDLPLI